MKARRKAKQSRKVVFGISEEQCIWMKAGVVNFKLCHNGFDCTTCSFDKAMQAAIKKDDKKLKSWRQEMLRKPHNEKVCRYMMSGDVPVKYCTNAYDCSTCEFDQVMQAYHETMVAGSVPKLNISGFMLADDYYYHPGHSWVRFEHGGLIRVGIDDFAFKLLGFLSEIKLPEIGTRVKFNQPGWSVRREEKIAPFVMPVEGIVVARNHKAMENPDIAKYSPYEDGWMIMIEPARSSGTGEALLYGENARGWLEKDIKELDDLVEDIYGMSLAATGGERVDDIYGNLKQLGWDNLVNRFILRRQ